MNKTQLKIIELASRKNIDTMSLREIGRDIDGKSPGAIKYHLDQLKKKGLLTKTIGKGVRKLQEAIQKAHELLINIPILGTANCGIATLTAEQMFDGYLKVSTSFFPSPSIDYRNLFAIRAKGNSMNKANIAGQNVDDGDYLIIDINSNPTNGKYVLSIIDGCANIKKFILENDRIILESESTENISPIFIHPDDNYLINGVVIKVIKKPKGGD